MTPPWFTAKGALAKLAPEPGESTGTGEVENDKNDRRRSAGAGGCGPGRGHAVRAARRPERPVLQRALRRRRAPARDRGPARAGGGLHGPRLRRRDRPAGRLLRRAGPGLPQHHGGAFDLLWCQRAGALPLGPDPLPLDRPRRRPAARDPGPARDHAAADEVGGADRGARGGFRTRRRGVPENAERPAAPGRARDADGRDGTRGLDHRRAAGGPTSGASRARSGRARARGRFIERRRATDDLRRRRRS